jgi:hypothetical protein
VCLFFGAHKQDGIAVRDRSDQEIIGDFEQPDGFLQVNDMNAVSRPEDVGLHFGVPPSRLVSEMDAGLEQLFHVDDCHFVFSFCGAFAAAPRFLHPPGKETSPESNRATGACPGRAYCP